MTKPGTDSDFFAHALELICRDDKLRREMLWLRAMEKGDRATTMDLERLDPDLVSRVADVQSRAANLDGRSTSEIYGAAQDERIAVVVEALERQAAGERPD